MHFKRLAQIGAAAALAAGAIAFGAGTASALPPGGCTLSTAADFSYVSPIHYPGGEALAPADWGGGGTISRACTGAIVNDNMVVWQYGSGPGRVGVAGDLTPVPVTGLSSGDQAKCTADGASGCFLLEYTPGKAQSGLCVSTVLDQLRAYARDRGCAAAVQDGTLGHAVNQWQDFSFKPEGDGFFQIEAVLEPTPYSLNIKGFGGDGTQVISWYPLGSCSGMGCSENEIFEQLAAA